MKFKRLFSEFKIKDLTLKNRIVLLAHYNGLSSVKGLMSEEDIYYYTERAKGGAGLIVSGNYAVSKIGQENRTCLNASDKGNIEGFKKLVNKVHKYNTKIFGQLVHCGSTSMEKPGSNLYAPSQVIEKSTNSYTKEMDKDNINEVINDFKKSAQNLTEGGFDGVEIKVGHDGLLRTFLSPYYNKRNDDYGKDLNGRAKIILEILLAIKKVIRDDMILGARICLDEFDDEGYNLEDGIEITKYIAKSGLIDYVDSDAGSWNIFLIDIPPMSIPLGFSEYMSAALKKSIGLPVIAYGRINDPVQAEQILENRSADLIGMARQLICDPETPKKAYLGQLDNIKKCIACNEGCVGQVMRVLPVKCIQSIAVGREKEFGIGRLRKADLVKKIVVVGGGVSGLKISEIAARRGHDVVLFEKNETLGGQINLLKKIPFRSEFSEVVRYLEYQVRHLKNIELRMAEFADSKKILEENPDILIIATGSEHQIPKFTHNKKIIGSRQLLDGNESIGENIIIYDKFSKNEGMGIAEYILEYYKKNKVHYVTPMPDLGFDTIPENKDIILRKLLPLNFIITSYHAISDVYNNKIILKNVYNERELELKDYENLIYIGDKKSCDNLYWQLKDKIKTTYRLGDAEAPGTVQAAIHHSEELARFI